jgi:hypothetical protein
MNTRQPEKVETPGSEPDLPTKLKQRRFLRTYEYILGLEGVTLIESNSFSSRVLRIPFEVIKDEPVEINSVSKLALGAIVIFLLLTIGSAAYFISNSKECTELQVDPFVWAFFATISAFCLFLSRKGFLVFGNLCFYRDRTKTKVLEFMQKVKTQKTDYFNKHVFARLGSDTSVNDIARLFWLKEHGVVTEEEFNKLKTGIVIGAEIRNTEPPSKN